MQQQTQPNIYQPIQAASRDIRLLKILSGDFNHPIDCETQLVDLNKENLEYETLSYVWGDSEKTITITVNGHAIEVTTNLGTALRYLRTKEETRVIWADAICINQENLEEKMHQVGMMGDIYRRCSRSYAWLGCDEERDHVDDKIEPFQGSDPFDFFHHFNAGKHLYELPGFKQNASEKGFEFQLIEAEVFQHQIWNGLRKTVYSPWWSRVWTVQEATLPPECVLLYGHSRTTLQRVRSFAIAWTTHTLNCCDHTYHYLPDFLHSIFKQLRSSIDEVNFIHNTHGNFYSLQLMHHYSSRIATNPRDKVYGLLGLSDQEFTKDISTDYTASTATVFEKAFKVLTDEYEGSLKCLMGSWFNSSNKQRNSTSAPCIEQVINLPSWVPNFGTRLPLNLRTAEIMRTTQYKCYNASHDTRANLHFGLDSTLHIIGKQAGTVKTTIDLPLTREDDIKVQLREWLNNIELKIENFDIQKRREFLETAMGALYFDRQPDWRRLACVKDFSIESWVENEDDDSQARIAVESTVFVATTGRSLFISEDESMGLCPQDTKPGDEVWIFNGGNIPFMVRHLREDDAGSYAFLGDCYLRGVMFGEAPAHNGSEIILK